MRWVHRYFDAPPSAVLLVPNDAELRALVALRCMQQDYRADAAREELRSYGLKLRVPKSVLDDVLQDVVDKFLSVHDWINVGSQCGELRLIKPFLLYSPPPFSPFPPAFAVFWDTIGTQWGVGKDRQQPWGLSLRVLLATVNRWGYA